MVTSAFAMKVGMQVHYVKKLSLVGLRFQMDKEVPAMNMWRNALGVLTTHVVVTVSVLILETQRHRAAATKVIPEMHAKCVPRDTSSMHKEVSALNVQEVPKFHAMVREFATTLLVCVCVQMVGAT